MHPIWKSSRPKALQPDFLTTLPDCGHTQHYGYLHRDSISITIRVLLWLRQTQNTAIATEQKN